MQVFGVVGPVLAGFVLGLVLVYIRRLPKEWAGLVTLALMAPTIVLVVNGAKKLLLIAFVVDIVLGLDISLAERTGHIGAPSGFLVSLMTMSLAVGYALWVVNKNVSTKTRANTHKDIAIPAAIYLLTLLISAFQSVDVWFSITQLFMEVQFFLMYLYIVNHVRSWDSVRLVFSTVAGCLLFEGALMLLQHFSGFQFSGLGVQSWTTGSRIASASNRTGGTIGSANAAGTILAAFLILSFAALVANGRLANKKLAFLAVMVGVPALVLTQSRSAWMAFAAGMIVLIVQSLRKGKGIKAIALLVVVGLLILVGFREVIVERLTTDDKGSADSRMWYTKLAFNIIKEHPFTGIGLNNLWLVQDNYLPIELERIQKQYRYIIHNKYWLVWTEAGVFSFLSFLWLLFAGLIRSARWALRTDDSHASIALTSLFSCLIVYVIHMSSDPFNARARMELFWIIISLIAATSHIVAEGKRKKEVVTFESGGTSS